MKKHWRVEDGVIVNDGQGAYLTTDKDYGDIELLVDFKIGPKGDSGVYLRGTPQVQIWDFTEPSYARIGADKGSGGLWNNSRRRAGKDPLVLADKPIGEWNTFRIIQVGERTTVYLNDKLVVEPRDPGELLEAHAADPGPRPDPAPDSRPRDPLAEHRRPRDSRRTRPTRSWPSMAREGFHSIFNGQNLADWAGPIENYEVKDGVSAMQAAQGGHDLLQPGAHRLHGPGRVQAAARRQQRSGDPLPGHGDTAYQACASSRSSTTRTPSTPGPSTPARRTARPTAWWPPTKATCGRSASGTSRR